MKKKIKNKPTISGIIVPGTWDQQGNVTGIIIQAYDEKAYRVEHTQPGRELMKHIHEKVEVTGKIRERINGSISIRVQSFSAVVVTDAEIDKL